MGTKRTGYREKRLPDRSVIVGYSFRKWLVARHLSYEQHWRLERELGGTYGALQFAPFALGCAGVVVLAIVGFVTLIWLVLG